MPHKTIWEKDGIYWQFYGDITLAEVHEANGEAYGDHRFDDIKYFIWNMTDVNNLEMSLDDAKKPACTDEVASSYKRRLNGAFAATDKHIRKVIERYIELSIEHKSTWNLKLFYTEDDARKWVFS